MAAMVFLRWFWSGISRFFSDSSQLFLAVVKLRFCGGFGENACFAVVLCGEVVVVCVVNVVSFRAFFTGERWDRDFNFIFADVYQNVFSAQARVR
jgi:hypothetical protein